MFYICGSSVFKKENCFFEKATMFKELNMAAFSRGIYISIITGLCLENGKNLSIISAVRSLR